MRDLRPGQDTPDTMQIDRRLLSRALPVLLSGVLLGGVFLSLDLDALRATLVSPAPGWLAAAVLLSVPQMALSAWRIFSRRRLRISSWVRAEADAADRTRDTARSEETIRLMERSFAKAGSA